MADVRRLSLSPQLDIQQLVAEAQQRWLRPAEICAILHNYQKFCIAPEAPNRPPSGSIFLFDRKALRYFRKDGHNWRKKKDGKTVREAHEKLKDGSVDVLHCYYAHGEENENFQRRSYWLLEEELMHIVLVHYLEVKGGKVSRTRESGESEKLSRLSHVDSPIGSSYTGNSQSWVLSQSTDVGSPSSVQNLETEASESVYLKRNSDICRARPRYDPFTEMQQHGDGYLMDSQINIDDLCHSTDRYQSDVHSTTSNLDDNSVADLVSARSVNDKGLSMNSEPISQFDSTVWDGIVGCSPLALQKSVFDTSVECMLSNDVKGDAGFEGCVSEESYSGRLCVKAVDTATAAGDRIFHQVAYSGADSLLTSFGDTEDDDSRFPIGKHSSFFKFESFTLKKNDSFTRWMSKELEVDDLQMKSSGDAYWTTEDDSALSCHEDVCTISPSLAQEQLFSIINLSPSFAYVGLVTKVLVTGTFLKNDEDVEKHSWSCMFGDMEVPADILADGTLLCYAPLRESGRFPFYVTCSDRLACSEVRDFEYREADEKYMETSSSCTHGGIYEKHLHMRLEKLLCLVLPADTGKLGGQSFTIEDGKSNLCTSAALLAGDEWPNAAAEKFENNRGDLMKFLSDQTVQTDQIAERALKEKLWSWLLQRRDECSSKQHLTVLCKEGQGVIHLVSGLGYDWAIRTMLAAGVNVNFRDIHGWTALHWAAFCGRERTVVTLIATGASPGVLTDPTSEFPAGQTPADLASANGHKGIAGFLAESSLRSHLSILTLKDSQGCGGDGQFPVLPDVDLEDHYVKSSSNTLSLKDSLGAVHNAVQAAAGIHQVFRVQSFQRKKLHEYRNVGEEGLSDEHMLSLLSRKNAKSGQDTRHLHAAATRIQNKFRGWKGRREFLVIRQRIIKIQAYVRGHQARKHYKFVWSVLIVEKALRWRRKIGSHGLRSQRLLEGSVPLQQQPQQPQQPQSGKEDEYDVLREGRKRVEAGFQRALSRVHSMVQYPEARDQYRRLLTVVTELQDKGRREGTAVAGGHELEMDYDMMMGLDELVEGDTSIAAAVAVQMAGFEGGGESGNGMVGDVSHP